MSIDPRLERSILAELSRSGRRAQRRDAQRDPARVLAEKVHRGQPDLLAHLLRVAYAVPRAFRSVAWLHHAGELRVTARELSAAGVSPVDVQAIALLAFMDASDSEDIRLARVHSIAHVPGPAGVAARVVARAAIIDIFARGASSDDTVAALNLLGASCSLSS